MLARGFLNRLFVFRKGSCICSPPAPLILGHVLCCLVITFIAFILSHFLLRFFLFYVSFVCQFLPFAWDIEPLLAHKHPKAPSDPVGHAMLEIPTLGLTLARTDFLGNRRGMVEYDVGSQSMQGPVEFHDPAQLPVSQATKQLTTFDQVLSTTPAFLRNNPPSL
jgi:hypothetical protein